MGSEGSISPVLSGVALSLDGKVALITGGSRGIGAAAVRLFRRAGARVAFSYRSAEAEALALEEECGGPEACVAIRQELASAADGAALVAAALAHFGSLDILVANHGVWPPHDQSIATMSDVQWATTVGVNLDSVFGLVRAAAAQMQRAGAGNIVLVSSTAGQRGEAFHADYAATKGALISMTKGLSTELARDGVRVNCVAPGWVETDMTRSTLTDPTASKKVFAAMPLGRVATPEEIAGPLLFLCTPLAGFITGEIFNVNGGAVLVG